MKWISTTERLPEFGRYVIARHNTGTWIDKDPNVVCVVVKRVSDNSPAGNNLMSYKWQTFGSMWFCGQEIDWWMEIPERP